MSGLIQNIITRQHHGFSESSEVNKQILEVNNNLRATQEQIKTTQDNLNRVITLFLSLKISSDGIRTRTTAARHCRC